MEEKEVGYVVAFCGFVKNGEKQEMYSVLLLIIGQKEIFNTLT